jgi:hypothetical protein
MKNSSLDAEPPSKFVREKEVSRKRNINLNQLILTIDSNKIKSNPQKREKNLEKQVRIKFQDYTADENYLKTNNNSIEEISKTSKAISFTSTLDMNPNDINSEFNYAHKKTSTTEITEKKPLSFYEMTSSYSFMPYMKKEDKKEDIYAQSREQEVKEPAYVLHNFDEEPEKEE